MEVKEDCVKQLLTGKTVREENLKDKVKINRDELIVVFNDDKFIGVYSISDSYNPLQQNFIFHYPLLFNFMSSQ